MEKRKRFNIFMISMAVILCFSATATITYAMIKTQITTASEQVTITGLGNVTATVALTSGNIFLANSDGTKTTTQTRLYPGGYFAVPLTVNYSGDNRPSDKRKVALKVGSGSFTISSIAVVCLGSGSGGAGTNATQFNKYFSLAQIKCTTGSTDHVVTAGTANQNHYYIFLQTKGPGDTNNTRLPINYLTNSITSLTLTFSVTAYSVE